MIKRSESAGVADDAYFLECARNQGGNLVTLDQQMKRIASQLGLRVLEP